MQVKSASTTTLVHEDIELGRGISFNPQISNHHRRRASKSPKFSLLKISAVLAGLGAIVALFWLLFFFHSWAKLIGREMFASDEENWDQDDRSSSNRKHKLWLIFYGFLITLELIIIIMALNFFVPWAYSKSLEAWELENSDQIFYVVQCALLLVAGVFIVGMTQGYMVGQEVALNNPYQEEVRDGLRPVFVGVLREDGTVVDNRTDDSDSDSDSDMNFYSSGDSDDSDEGSGSGSCDDEDVTEQDSDSELSNDEDTGIFI